MQTLSYGFVYDDIPFIVENQRIKDIKNIPEMFFKMDVLGDVRGSYYKPLLNVAFLVDYYIWGLNPLGFHLSNIILHVISVILVFFLAMRLLNNTAAAFIASLFFGIHPVNTETVTFLSARNTILCAIFTVSSFLAFIRYREKERAVGWLIVSLVLFFMGLLSKEFAVMLPFVMLLSSTSGENIKKSRRVYIPYFAVLAVYIVLRSIVLKGSTLIEMKIAELPQRMAGMLYAFASYIRLTLIPFGQKAIYDINTVTNLRILISAIVLFAVVWAVFKNRGGLRLGFASIWFLGFLAPVTNIIPLFGSFMAERYLYIPIIGVCIFVGSFFSALPKGRIRTIAFAGFFLMLALMSLYRNPVWRSDESLYNDMIKTTPTSYKGYYNLGNFMFNAGNLKEAERLYLKALEASPDMMAIRNNLGVLYEKTGNYKEAEKQYREILYVRHIPDVYRNLGNVLNKLERLKEAEDAYKTAIKLSPESLYLYETLVGFYEKTDRPKLALEVMLSAIRNIPDSYMAYNIAGTILGKMGDYKEAKYYFMKALQIKPDCYECKYNMEVLILKMLERKEIVP